MCTEQLRKTRYKLAVRNTNVNGIVFRLYGCIPSLIICPMRKVCIDYKYQDYKQNENC